jgi:long-subunit acyl-CoA synthetase (AMP-forming)
LGAALPIGSTAFSSHRSRSADSIPSQALVHHSVLYHQASGGDLELADASGTTAGTASSSAHHNPNTNTNTLGERKSSFTVGNWMRDPLADAAADVLARPTTVWHAFEQIVHRTPDANAVCKYDAASETTSSVTWRELHAHVVAMVKVLVHLGLGLGDGVVISAKSSLSLYVIHLATIAAGGVVAHIRPNWRPDELARHIFPNAKAKIVVLDSLTENFVRAIRETVPSEDGRGIRRPHDVRAVISLRNYSTERVLAMDLPVSLLTMDDVRNIALECEATHLQLLDPLSDAVLPTDCCVISFGYDPLGRVRGTCLSHDNVMFTAANLARSCGPLSFVDRLVAYLPLHHVGAQVIELFMPLLCGVTVYCYAPPKGSGNFSGGPLINLLKSCRPTIFFATPDTWAHISLQVYRAKSDVNSFIYRWAKARATNNSKKLRFGHDAHRSLGYMIAKKLVLNNLKKRIGLESCHACYSVLAPLDFELEKLFKTIDIPIYQLYGVPECSGFASLNFPHAWEFGTCGRALEGTVMEYDDISHELLLRGRHVFLGYVRFHGQIVPAHTSDGWLRVPQQGHLTPDGFLKINDPPRHFLVLSTGEWVPTEPYERALRDQPELERAVLVGDGRTFLSVLLFMKTAATQQLASIGGLMGTMSGLVMSALPSRGTSVSSGASYMLTSSSKAAAQRQAHYVLCDNAIQLGQSLGSSATTVAEVVRCQRWAIHFDRVVDELPRRINVSGVQVRKWIIMSEEFSVDGGELDGDTGDVKRRVVDTKYQSLLDSMYI